MKHLLSLVMLLASFAALAQTPVNFELHRSGFSAPNGEDFVVVPMENASAHTIFQTIYANVVPLVNDGQKQITVVDDAMIKVALPMPVTSMRQLLVKYDVFGTFIFEFKIKDGRVRVGAPYIEGMINGVPSGIVGSEKPFIPVTFNSILADWFEKSGKPKEKKIKEIDSFTFVVNYTINTALGLTTSKKQEDNW